MVLGIFKKIATSVFLAAFVFGWSFAPDPAMEFTGKGRGEKGGRGG